MRRAASAISPAKRPVAAPLRLTPNERHDSFIERPEAQAQPSRCRYVFQRSGHFTLASIAQLPTPLPYQADPQAYNSVFNSDSSQARLVGNFPLLPLRTKTRGPAYALPAPDPPLPAFESPDPDSESYDILDEVLALFRANTFFRNFEIQGPADRLLVYGIWFVSDCLTKIKPSAGVRDAQKDLMNLALDSNFALPGDPGWPMNQVSRYGREGIRFSH